MVCKFIFVFSKMNFLCNWIERYVCNILSGCDIFSNLVILVAASHLWLDLYVHTIR